MPLLSVVVPTKDRIDRLGAAVASLRAQTMSDLEIIIVDDASSDGTGELLARLEASDRRVRTIRLPGNGGAANARNAGIAVAGGEFLAFLDDDDTWMPGKAEGQIRFLRAHPDTGLVSCDFLVVDGKESLVHRGPHEFEPSTLMWANVLMGCSFVMLRRTAFSFDLGFDQDVVPAEDWDLWLRCAMERRVASLASVLSTYALHGEQLTGSTERLHRGDSGFFSKHRDKMSPHALAYHSAHLRMIRAAGAADRIRMRIDIMRDTPPRVLGVMARLAISGRLARVLRDPGRPFRTLARAVARID